MTLKLHENVCKLSHIWLICIPARFSNFGYIYMTFRVIKMSVVIKNYIRSVIFEKNGVGDLPHWASCPTLPYIIWRAFLQALEQLFTQKCWINDGMWCFMTHKNVRYYVQYFSHSNSTMLCVQSTQGTWENKLAGSKEADHVSYERGCHDLNVDVSVDITALSCQSLRLEREFLESSKPRIHLVFCAFGRHGS